MMDKCPMLHSKHGHIKSQKMALTTIARCDVNKVEKGNNNHKGVKHADIQPGWCSTELSKTQKRRIQRKRFARKTKCSA
jgi:hypothetical protein